MDDVDDDEAALVPRYGIRVCNAHVHCLTCVAYRNSRKGHPNKKEARWSRQHAFSFVLGIGMAGMVFAVTQNVFGSDVRKADLRPPQESNSADLEARLKAVELSLRIQQLEKPAPAPSGTPLVALADPAEAADNDVDGLKAALAARDDKVLQLEQKLQELQAASSAGVATGACNSGFAESTGDIAGWGKVHNRGGGERIAQCSECADLCSSDTLCASYECSPTEKKCNLNSGATPTTGAYKDYIFCAKIAQGSGKRMSFCIPLKGPLCSIISVGAGGDLFQCDCAAAHMPFCLCFVSTSPMKSGEHCFACSPRP